VREHVLPCRKWWTMQKWTKREDNAGMEIAGVDIYGLAETI